MIGVGASVGSESGTATNLPHVRIGVDIAVLTCWTDHVLKVADAAVVLVLSIRTVLQNYQIFNKSSVCSSVYLSVCLSVCLSSCPSVRLSLSLSVCLSLSDSKAECLKHTDK